MPFRFALASLLALSGCVPGERAPGFSGTLQECRLRIDLAPPERIDVLFVVDDSSAMASHQARIAGEIARIVDEQLAFDESHYLSRWYHFGVLRGDPSGSAILQGGCGIADATRFVGYLRGAVSNLKPAVGVGSAVGCLTALGAGGTTAQQPMGMAARLLTTDIPENRGFRRLGAVVAVIFLQGAAYAENGEPLLAARRPDPLDYVFASVAPSSPDLDRVVAAAATFAQLALTETSWSPLLAWAKAIISGGSGRACLRMPPRDPARPDFVVEDVTWLPGGRTSSTLLPPCVTQGWEPSCWDLAADWRCEKTGLHLDLRRPITGTPPSTTTFVSYDCATAPP